MSDESGRASTDSDAFWESFAPAGKVFKEWVLVEDFDAEQWDALLRESVAFVG